MNIGKLSTVESEPFVSRSHRICLQVDDHLSSRAAHIGAVTMRGVRHAGLTLDVSPFQFTGNKSYV